ncbi:MAG: hypothetical protein KDA41_22785 [Planctomycetales bacterium]|nr:hypothetical protein [Planctomycetales bacterium]
MLAVFGKDSQLRAVAFGYACHNTTLASFEWSGDYAGFAQRELQRRHPNCIAMFWEGCGGDQNPLPRRTVELAQQYGEQLAEAVDKTLGGGQGMRDVQGGLRARYAEIDLPLGRLPSREELQSEAKSTNKYVAARANYWIDHIDSGKSLSASYPYPVQSWRVGDDIQFVFLGGEVVVDYAIRLKQQHGDEPMGHKNVWVAGYSNDVMAYIPSRRVLVEGGYEGAGAMVYYGLPTVWSPEAEEAIAAEVKRQSE